MAETLKRNLLKKIYFYHDISFQKLGRLQGDAYTVSVAWTNVAETKTTDERQSEPEFGSSHMYLEKLN